jgi:uncharacterized protein YcbK (DUF882 family)
MIKKYSLSKDGNTNITHNFKVKEFACHDGSDLVVIDVDFVVNILQKMRDYLRVPITINSAYRTKSYNTKVGGAKSSYHMLGRAFDISCKYFSQHYIAKVAEYMGVKGIIVYSTFTHIDSRTSKYFSLNAGKTSVSTF